MTQRASQLLWLKDVLEHLRDCQERLEWAEDPESARLLLDNMVRDLDCGKQLCESIKVRTPRRQFSVASR